MRVALRLLVFFLVLGTSGIFQSFACAADPSARAEVVADACDCCDHADEQREPEQRDCAECGFDCGICIACRVTVAPQVSVTAPVAIVLQSEAFDYTGPKPSYLDIPDIFQPPKA